MTSRYARCGQIHKQYYQPTHNHASTRFFNISGGHGTYLLWWTVKSDMWQKHLHTHLQSVIHLRLQGEAKLLYEWHYFSSISVQTMKMDMKWHRISKANSSIKLLSIPGNVVVIKELCKIAGMSVNHTEKSRALIIALQFLWCPTGLSMS